jgi:hypothetical protein
MSGIPQFNFPAFDAAAKKLRNVHGLAIISPAELDDAETRKAAMASPDGSPGHVPGKTWGDFLARDVKIVADECSGVVLLPGWQVSRGAKLEAYVGILCFHYFAYYIAGDLIGARYEDIMEVLAE